MAVLGVGLVIAGCALRPAGSPSPSAGGGVASVLVTGSVVAGPTCPVVTEPPQPGCDERPVAAAVILVVSGDGNEVASLTSGPDGTFRVSLAPGRYRLEPRPVEGLMGTAPEQAFTVGDTDPKLVVAYDTGIR